MSLGGVDDKVPSSSGMIWSIQLGVPCILPVFRPDWRCCRPFSDRFSTNKSSLGCFDVDDTTSDVLLGLLCFLGISPFGRWLSSFVADTFVTFGADADVNEERDATASTWVFLLLFGCCIGTLIGASNGDVNGAVRCSFIDGWCLWTRVGDFTRFGDLTGGVEFREFSLPLLVFLLESEELQSISTCNGVSSIECRSDLGDLDPSLDYMWSTS